MLRNLAILILLAGVLAGCKAPEPRYLSRAPLAQRQQALSYNDQGIAHCQAGDHAAAVTAYSQALQLDPDPIIRNNRGICYRDLAQYDKAVADHTVSLARLDLASFYGARGLTRYKMGEYALAVADLDQAIAREPGAPAHYNVRGWAREQLDDLAGAARDCDRAIELAPDHPPYWNNRGQVRGKLGDGAGAIADLNRAIELSTTPEGRANYLNRRGHQRVRMDDRAGALEDYKLALQLHRDPVYHYNIGYSLARLQRDQEALNHLNLAAEAGWEDPDLLVERASIRHRLGDLAGAAADAQAAIDQSHGTPYLYRVVGDWRRSQAAYRGAVAAYSAALEGAPADRDALLGRAIARHQLAQFEEARSDLDTAIAHHPKDANLYSTRAWVLRYLGHHSEAYADADRAVQLAPDVGELLRARAVMRRRLGETGGALEDCRAALDLHPQPGQVHLTRGFVLLLADRREEATAAFQAAYEEEVANAIPWLGLLRESLDVRAVAQRDDWLGRAARCYLGELTPEAVLQEAKTPLHQQTLRVALTGTMAVLAEAGGDPEGARRHLQEVLSLDPAGYSHYSEWARHRLDTGG